MHVSVPARRTPFGRLPWSQTFSSDALSRLTGSSGPSTGPVAYTYDLDANRLSRIISSDTDAAVYDRTDELVSISKNGGFPLAAVYSATGDLTSDPETGTPGTAIGYADDRANVMRRMLGVRRSVGSILSRENERTIPGTATQHDE